MEQGNISEWVVKEGQAISAGDTLAMVETDKVPLSSFNFHSQTLLSRR